MSTAGVTNSAIHKLSHTKNIFNDTITYVSYNNYISGCKKTNNKTATVFSNS